MKLVFNFRNWSILLFLAIPLALLTSCSPKDGAMMADYPNDINSKYATTVKGSKKAGDPLEPNKNHPSNLELADMLRKAPGVIVNGAGQNAVVRIRGVSSFYGGSEPLFVVNGTPVGTGFSSVVNAINPNDIKTIHVLKGPDATIYGVRGSNGVILIKLK